MIGVGAAGPTGREARSSTSRASEREHWIALSMVPGIGPASFAQLLRRHGSAAAAWAAGSDGVADTGGLPAGIGDALDAIRRQDPRTVARQVIERTGRVGGRVITAADDEYPPALLTLDPRPAVLYVVGDLAAFSERAVAIVGTRRASGYGFTTAGEIGADLAGAGVVVVSGLALGIDGAAHRAAVSAGGRSIAVLPSPLDRFTRRAIGRWRATSYAARVRW